MSDSEELLNYGYANYLEVLTARENTLNSQLELVNARFNRLNAVVELYQALGGGWEYKESSYWRTLFTF
jgi:outer membrane protein, multidrug efflux system